LLPVTGVEMHYVK